MRCRNFVLWAICSLSFTFNLSVYAEEAVTQTVTIKSLRAADLYAVQDEANKEFVVRLYGVQAPLANQAQATKALKWASDALKGKSFALKPLAEDSHGHTVARITLADGKDLGTALLHAGLAWADSENAPKDRGLKKAMVVAIRASKGIWSAATPLAPWDYRKSHDLPPVVYTLEEEKPKEVAAPVMVEEEPKVLKFKGNEAPHQNIDWQQYENLQAQDIMGLAAKAGISIKGGGVTVGNAGAVPILGQLGIQSGDVITNVNGLPLKSELDILNAVQKLEGSKSLEIVVNRGGGTVTIPIPIP